MMVMYGEFEVQKKLTSIREFEQVVESLAPNIVDESEAITCMRDQYM